MLLMFPLALIINRVKGSGKNKIFILDLAFEKFMLAFLVSSTILTSLSDSYKENVSNNCFLLAQWFSNSGFVLIGFNINLKILLKIKEQWRILLLYTIAKILDTGIVFGIVYFIFEE